MDYSAAKFWFDVAQTVFLLLLGILQFLYHRQAATVSGLNRVDEHLNKQIALQGSRLTRVEETIKSFPTHNDLGKIYDKLNELNGSFNKLSGEFSQVSHALTRLYDNELSKKP